MKIVLGPNGISKISQYRQRTIKRTWSNRFKHTNKYKSNGYSICLGKQLKFISFAK